MHEHTQSTDEATFVWPQLDQSTYLLNVLIYKLVVSLSPATQVHNLNNLNARFRHSFWNRKPDWIAQRWLCVFHPVIDNPARSVIDIFSFQCIRGTLYSNPDRYCVTRPRFLLVRNVASCYDPWPHFFLHLAVQPEFFRSRGERVGSGKERAKEIVANRKESLSKDPRSELDRKSTDRFVSRAIISSLAYGSRDSWQFVREISRTYVSSRCRRTWFSVLLIVQRNDRATYSVNRADFVTRSELNASSREIRVETVAFMFVSVDTETAACEKVVELEIVGQTDDGACQSRVRVAFRSIRFPNRQDVHSRNNWKAADVDE